MSPHRPATATSGKTSRGSWIARAIAGVVCVGLAVAIGTRVVLNLESAEITETLLGVGLLASVLVIGLYMVDFDRLALWLAWIPIGTTGLFGWTILYDPAEMVARTQNRSGHYRLNESWEAIVAGGLIIVGCLVALVVWGSALHGNKKDDHDEQPLGISAI